MVRRTIYRSFVRQKERGYRVVPVPGLNPNGIVRITQINGRIGVPFDIEGALTVFVLAGSFYRRNLA